MSRDMNVVVLNGNLVRDPESFALPSGTTKARFVLAVNDGRTTNSQTSFIPVEVLGSPADNILKYLKKGSKVGVQGRLYMISGERTQVEEGEPSRWYKNYVHADRVTFMSGIRSNEELEEVMAENAEAATGNASIFEAEEELEVELSNFRINKTNSNDVLGF